MQQKGGETMEEQKLLDLLQKRPEKALEQIMKQYMGLCYTIVKNRLADFSQQEIEECVSDVFVDIFNGREHISLEKGSLKTYICVIARRKAGQRYKNLVENQSLSLTEEFSTFKNEYEQMENRSLLLQCIAELGEPDSHIFMMKYYFGYSTKMIAEKFQLKENTVDKKVQRGLQKLKKALEGGAYYES